MDGPNPIAVGWSVLKSLRTRRPAPTGQSSPPGHDGLAEVLQAVAAEGVTGLPAHHSTLRDYIGGLSRLDPDSLDTPSALAYWLNLYNAGALRLAADAYSAEEESVLRVPGAFTEPFVSVAGEHLSLSDVEHGKIRRFKDPRIHSALVCGSVSCPTLRPEPYDGVGLDAQLDAQTRSFLASGGAVSDGDRLLLSRVFLWYGGDFVRPARMPTFLPARRRRIAQALGPWLPDGLDLPQVAFQPYDWGLACSVNPTD